MIKTEFTENIIENVEIYLEGVLIPTFNNFSISEVENTIPAASISFPVSKEVLRVLPGTIVHIFVTTKLTGKEPFLAFEGEVTQMSFTVSLSSLMVQIRAISLLSEMYKATLRPGHSIISTARNDAELNHKVQIRVENSFKTKDGANIFHKKDIETKEVHEGTLNQLKEIATFGDIANTMSTAFNAKGSEMSKGNFIEFLKEVQRFFIQSDLYYGIQAITYRIAQSIIALPNKVTGFDLKVTLQSLNNLFVTMSQYPTGNTPTHQLINILAQFQQFLGYKFISTASPIACKYFHVQDDSAGYINRPLRMIMLPDIESGPAPLCNVFYPEQYLSFGFTRDFSSEPTRMIGQLNYSFLDKSVPAEMMPITVVPQVTIYNTEKNKTNITSKYTDEETYRGVVLKVAQHDGAIIQALSNEKSIKTVGDKKSVQPLNAEDKKEIMPNLKKMVLSDYLKLKYGQRGVSIQTAWNPYRIVGLPALLIKPGFPSIVGIIQQISTQFSANGAANSSCSLRNCHLIFDEDENSIFGLENKSTDTDSLDSFVVPDMLNGGMIGANPLMYNSTYYDIQTIGKEIYPIFMYGGIAEGTKITEFFKDNKLYKNSASSFIKIPEEDKSHDFSILYFLDDEIVENTKKEELEIFNTKIIYKAVKKLKEVYNKAADKNSLINMLGTRVLLTKSDYETAMGGLNLDTFTLDNWKNNSKDLASILQDKNLSYSKITKTLVTMHDYLNNDINLKVLELSKKGLTEEEKTKLIKEVETKKITLIKDLNKNRTALSKETKTEKKETLTNKITEIEEELKILNTAIDSIKNNTLLGLTDSDFINEFLMKTLKLKDKDIQASSVRNATSIFRPFNTTRRAHIQQIRKDFKVINNITVVKNE